MAINKTDDALLARATRLVGAVGSLTKLSEELRDAEAIDALVEKLRVQAGALVTADAAHHAALTARDATRREIRVLLSRIQAGVQAVYGPDSIEVEQAGGVRNSQRAKRKPRARAASPNATPAPAPTPTPAPPPGDR